MALLNFSISALGQRSPAIQSTEIAQSGAFTTTASAAYVTAGSPATTVILKPGQIFVGRATAPMRINFDNTLGSTPATASTGHYIPANETIWFECKENSTISVIDAA